MKTKSLIYSFSTIMVLFAIFSFTKNTNKEKIGKFVLVPAGSTTINDKIVSLDSYWISDHEITNYEYNRFLADLKNQGKTKEYDICKVQTDKWKFKHDVPNTPYVKYYNIHEAYTKHPALNISHEAAKLYCDWLTDNYKDKTQMFRLPTKEEWIYAARGGIENAKYSWGGMELRNKKGENMCNYRLIGDEFIHSNSEQGITVISEPKNLKSVKEIRSADVPAPVISFWPNRYGLYNTCGNVAEMISENGIAMGGSWRSTGYDVQITSELEYSAPNPFIGFRPVRVNKK